MYQSHGPFSFIRNQLEISYASLMNISERKRWWRHHVLAVLVLNIVEYEPKREIH